MTINDIVAYKKCIIAFAMVHYQFKGCFIAYGGIA